MSEHCEDAENFISVNLPNDEKWDAIRAQLVGYDAVILRKSDDGEGYCLRGALAGERIDL